MKLKTLVISISIFQAILDLAGIFINLYFENIVKLVPEEQAPRKFPDIAWKGDSILYTDYSVVRNVNILYYTVPYIFSGVIPRMLNGFECLTADQLVSTYLAEWTQVMGLKEGIKEVQEKFPEDHRYWIEVLNRTVTNLNHSLDKRKKHCQNSHVLLPNISLIGVKKKDYMEDFKSRRAALQNENSYRLMQFFELATMFNNSLASILVVILACSREKLPLLHIPWLLLSAIEIAGNGCVGLAFLIVPGYCQLTSLVCILRVLWLGTVWSKAIRRSMMLTLPTLMGYDQEGRMLRSQLSNKGKQRFGRFFGTYNP